MTAFEMPKTYDPSASERRIYDWWESSGYFKPEIAPADAQPFVISIPPPNITGELHLGHAMFVSLEDLMIRYKRMRGYAALWVPGYDHAGIATQLQVEKMLARGGLRRQDIGRAEFLRRTWEWKEKYGGHIVRQLRRLGASCDWDRLRFTMDEGLSRAVREAFVRLYRMGLIYRGEYLINWSPGLQTAVSDLEVEYTEEDATLYYFKYPIAGAHPGGRTGQGLYPRGDDPARNDPGRHGRGRAPGRRALPPPDRRDLPRADAEAPHPRDPRHLRGHGVRHRRAQDHARPRPQRLRDRPAARPADHQHARQGRQGERGRRAVRGAGPLRGPQEALGRHGSRRPDHQDRALSDAGAALAARAARSSNRW